MIFKMALSESVGEQDFEADHLWNLFSKQVSNDPDKTAIIKLWKPEKDSAPEHKPTTLTFRQLHGAATTMAVVLNEHGVGKGDFVNVCMENRIEYVVAIWAVFRLGAILVPISLTMLDAPKELEHMLKAARPAAMIVNSVDAAALISELFCGKQPKHQNGLRDQLGGFGILTPTDGQYTPYSAWPFTCEETRTGNRGRLPESVLSPDDDGLLMFTSGSTSLPKGCLHTHRSFAWGSHSFSKLQHMGPNSRMVAHRALFHAFALGNAIGMTLSGGALVLPTSRDFEPGATIHAITEGQCTHMIGPPAMITALVEHPNLPTGGLPSLRSIELGGNLVAPAVIATCKQRLKAQIATASYGMTETCGLLAHDQDKLDDTFGTGDQVAVPVGKPIPGISVKICDPDSDNAEVVQRGTDGELHVTGEVTYRKYIGGTGDPTYLDSDGRRWIKTGDQANMDSDGNITIVGRYKDVIIREADNLVPARIAGTIEQLDSVDESMVVPIPNGPAGQLPVAVVKHKLEAAALDNEEIQYHVATSMGEEQTPVRVLSLSNDLSMDSWPTNGAGKPDKKALTEAVRQHLTV
ncbi:Acyl-CoA ligase SID4 [Pseudocercospora fuligena]|uniref:Acyl-CoA ligase SID4 n=1 Tax=Pseudocercospora fuligena TaxID=685502 RepID=A0A8H6VHB3_9PEZI|nr:Acyl-CoA ligase SID4 [Pseudocercospora fuligena]